MKKVVIGDCILFNGDCLEVLDELSSGQIHSCVTDPPYHLTSIVKRFGAKNAAPVKVSEFFTENGKTKGSSPYLRSAAGFMGQQWDGGDIAFRPDTWEKVINALKPGGHLCAFSGTRTYHRMAVAIEDAGFEIRDMIAWLYGSGFPKSHDVSKGIDKAARGFPHGGPDPTSPNHGKFKGGCSEENEDGRGFGAGPGQFMKEQGTTVARELVDEAKRWQGWGTAIKPAQEPITLARKPLSEKTVAANVLEHGTGAINIDASRVGSEQRTYDLKSSENLNKLSRSNGKDSDDAKGLGAYGIGAKQISTGKTTVKGRWPANVVHDGSEEVLEGFPDTGKSSGGRIGNAGGGTVQNIPTGHFVAGNPGFGDSGSAARFFYCAKTSKKERGEDNNHPTVKPIALMEWLVKLVTPKGGVVLDPFMGSGSTGLACVRNGFKFIGIEKDHKYFDIACKRIEAMVNEQQNKESLESFFTEEQHIND